MEFKNDDKNKHFLNKYTKILIILILIGFLGLFIANSRTDTYLGRWFSWRASDINDHLKFSNKTIEKAENAFHFAKSESDLGSRKISLTVDGRDMVADLDSLLSENESTAFIVIKDDEIRYEKYFNGYERDSINTSFSIAKSLTAFLVGIAVDEGLIADVSDPITKYIPELEQTDPEYSDVVIENLLSMKSGIEFADHDLPWGDKPKAYYHPNLRQHLYTLEVINNPGEQFNYNSYNPIFLGLILEKVTTEGVAAYFEKKIWKQIGAEFDASWSVDSKESGMVKMESGFNARAIDFAKIGRLVLNQGKFENNQVVSQRWIEKSTELSKEKKVDGFGANTYYNRGWWLYSEDENQYLSITAQGHLGQYLYIFPDKNIIIVRFGKGTGDVNWHQLFQIVAELA